MSLSFNPYHKWLGIPPEQQPPNHYQLLGITLFESDVDVIEAAAERQIAHVQRFKSGEQAALAKELLNELSAAKLCLLLPEKKAAYDQKLKAAQTPKSQPSPAASSTRLPRATPLAAPVKSPAPEVAAAKKVDPPAPVVPKSRKRTAIVLSGVAAGSICLVVVVAVMLGPGSGQGNEDPVGEPPAKPLTSGNSASPAENVAGAAPRLQAVAKQTVKEGERLLVTLKLQEPQLSAGVLYALGPNAPEGASLDPRKGELSWQPTEEQGPQTYQLAVRLLQSPGEKQLDQSTIEVVVEEVNQPPTWEPLTPPTVNQSGQYTFQLRAKDPDLPANQLAYSFESELPKGAALDPATGVFTWKPSPEDAGKQVELSFRVTDGKSSATQAVRIKVEAAKSETPAVASNNPPAPATPNPPPVEASPSPPAAPVAAAKRMAVPSSAEQSKALAEIKEIFREQYKGRKPEEKTALARELLKAYRTAEGAASRYVLLDEVNNLAAGVGEVLIAWQAIDSLAAEFDVEAIELKTAGLKKMSTLRNPEVVHAVAAQYVELVDEAAAADNYDAAIPLITTGLTVAQRTKDAQLISQLQNRGKDLRAMKKEYDTVQAAMAVLKSSPDDPAANLTVGCYFCFAKDKLADGLPLLAKCGNEKLALAAKRDLVAPDNPEGHTAAGDAWWAAAEPARGTDKERYQQRAAHWYRLALPQLTGLEKVKLEKRLEGVPLASSKSAFNPPPVITPAPGPSLSSLPADLKNERKVVEQFVKAKIGSLYVKVDSQRNVRVSKEEEIPQGGFVVQSVSMMNAVVTDDHMEMFKNLKFIDSISLMSGSTVSDAGVAHLQSLASLKRVTLYDTQLTDKGLTVLARLPRLENVHIRGGNLTGAGLASLSALTGLTSVEISSNQLTDDTIAAVAKLPRLQRLTISGLNIRGTGLSALKSCVALSSLELDSANFDESQLAGLAGAPSLRSLNIKGTFTEASLVHIGKINNLRNLQWEGAEFGTAGAKSLASLRALEQLTLRDISDDTLKAVASLNQLKDLNVMSAGRLTDKGLAPLANMPALTNLSLQNASALIGNDGLAHVAKMPVLQYVYISGQTNISDAGLASFRGRQQLRNLNLYNSQVTDAGVKAFKQMLPNCQLSK